LSLRHGPEERTDQRHRRWISKTLQLIKSPSRSLCSVQSVTFRCNQMMISQRVNKLITFVLYSLYIVYFSVMIYKIIGTNQTSTGPKAAGASASWRR
jgi:hypothetical protein